MGETHIHSSWTEPDPPFESSLRPLLLSDFIGQEAARERLEILIKAAQQRKEAVGHCLFHGPPGVGKTTLAHVIAKTLGTNLVISSGPVIEKAADLAGLLTHLEKGDVLFIDEIHSLKHAEYLYPAMENFFLDLIVDKGHSARSVQVKLNPFTLVGATTRSGLLSGPLRSRFTFTCRLDYYDSVTLEKILQRSARILEVSLSGKGAREIALRSRGTPRIANNLLRWVRDCAQLKGMQEIGEEVAREALDMLSIDESGLDEMDKKLLSVIIDHHDGGPVGIKTLAVAVGEEEKTLAEVYEPFLIMEGFLSLTPRGRKATPKAYRHLKRNIKTGAVLCT